MERKKSKSLKGSLVRLVLLCWILPVILITMLTITTVVRSINKQVVKNASTMVSSAKQVCMERINFAVDSARYVTYNTTIKRSYNSFKKNNDYVELYQNIDTFLVGNYKFDNKFMLTLVQFLESDEEISGDVFYTFNEALFPSSKSETGREAYGTFVESDSKAAMEFAKTLDTYVGFLNCDGRLYIVRNLYLDYSEPKAVLVMRLNTSDWFDAMTNTSWSKNVTLALNGESLVVTGEKMDLNAIVGEYQENGNKETNSVNYNGELYFCDEIQTNDYTFSYAVLVDDNVLLREVQYLRYLLLIISLLIIPLIAIVFRYFQKNVNEPIRNLTSGAGEIEKGNFGYQVTSDAKSAEFIHLTDTFNEMSAQLKDQFDRIYREELALRDAKIKALESQINPHFLNNTLEIINWEARLGNTANVSSMIEALSTMMNAAMNRDENPLVHLSQEMMYVDAYLYIIGERFGKRLEIKKEIDKSLLDMYVPRLILQPIIENAVEHGVSPLQQGVIIIRIRRDEENIYIEIENNGDMSEDDERKVSELLKLDNESVKTSSAHLGIRNVHERLKIIYGDKSGLSINVTNEKTVLAKITIPISQKDN